MKIYSCFYKLEDYFYKYTDINLPLFIESEQSPKGNVVAVDKNNLEGYNSNLNLELETFYQTTTYETKKKKI